MSTVFRLRRPSGATTALVALLVTSLAAPAAFPDAVGTQRIDDSFSGNAIDPNIWWFATNRPEAVAISEAEGHVTVNISGRAGNDFDARISFELGAWPAFDGVWVGLMAACQPGRVQRHRCHSIGGRLGNDPARRLPPHRGRDHLLLAIWVQVRGTLGPACS